MENKILVDVGKNYAVREWISDEFDETLYDIPEFISEANGWVDNSWHNDVSPRWHNQNMGICIWIGDRAKENSECLYCVQKIDADGSIDYEGILPDLLVTDSLNELTAFIESILIPSRRREDLINKIIEGLAMAEPPKDMELKRLLFTSRLESAFYKAFKIYLPIRDLTIEELDNLTGYSSNFIKERVASVNGSFLPPRQALESALAELELAKKESDLAIHIVHQNMTASAAYCAENGGNEWVALHIKESAYHSTISPIYKNIEALLGFQGISSKRAVAKFLEDALIGYSIAHCEATLSKICITT